MVFLTRLRMNTLKYSILEQTSDGRKKTAAITLNGKNDGLLPISIRSVTRHPEQPYETI